MADSEPIPAIVGDWYSDTSGGTFEVIATEDDGTIEVQYFDGTVEEIDADTWNELILIPIEPPEDWSGSMDIERADYGVDLDNDRGDDWGNPLDYIDME